MAGDSSDKEEQEQRSDSDATGEFFSVGVPLHAVRAGYVKRRADDQLYSALIAGQYAHVVAPDRSGKSSLVAAIAARLESNGYKVAILDLGQLGDRDGGTDSGRWYYSVAYRLLRQLRIRYDLQSWWQDKSILSNRQRLFEFYSEIILQNISEPVVIFVDEIQCIEDLPHADQLLTSIRSAHNARNTDPDFSRLSFVLLGECDPVSLMQEAELSPFNVTQQIQLDDFTRDDLELFATELNLGPDEARLALDRIFYWTNGQPYLCQKLARAVAREVPVDDVTALVDRIAMTQIGGRAALHSEPHMSHIHRAIVTDDKRCEPLLNLYGKIRKGIDVPADLGSDLQRRLMALGLLVINDDSNIGVRNRLYRHVFTARWANENLPTRFKVPAVVAGVLLVFAMIPFWYTQWLPNPYVRALTSIETPFSEAQVAFNNFQSFPGHTESAENLYRGYLEQKAKLASLESDVTELAAEVSRLPNAGRLADEIVAAFWDRRANTALKAEDRDAALLARINSLTMATSYRRQRAASLVADDYPYLLTTLPAGVAGIEIFDPRGMLLTTASGARITQFAHTPQGVQMREPWSVTALEVSPLLRRVIVDREGTVSRIGLTLNLSHARLSDLRIKVIAPSGRTIEVEPDVESASSNDDVRIDSRQLVDLIGESLTGTWSISVRDESLGVAGQLVGWNLRLNSQGAVEYFQRGLNIPDPVERETDDIWFDPSGRHAVARAMQSDSARLWDLSFAEPVRAIALHESERLIGLDASARRLVTATQDSVNLWDTATGDRMDVLPIGAASNRAMLTDDGTHLFVEHPGDVESRLVLWNLDGASVASEIVVPGVPALIAIDASGGRVAVSDFDQSVRVWDFKTGDLLGQFDLPSQPGNIQLSANGKTLAATFPNVGFSVWNVATPLTAMLQQFGEGRWKVEFSPSGSLVAAGRSETGFQVFNTADGRRVGPPLGLRGDDSGDQLLAFSLDEKILLTGSGDTGHRIWRVPAAGPTAEGITQPEAHTIWRPAANSNAVAAPNGSFVAVGDALGHVHFIDSGAAAADLVELSEDVSFVGHNSSVEHLGVSADSTLAVSIAEDNTVRLWDTASGEPLPFVVEIDGQDISRPRISPQGGFVGVLSGNRVSVIDANDGKLVAAFDSADMFSDLAFSSEDKLYLGSDSGALQVLIRDTNDSWSLQQVWQGMDGIQHLQASPNGEFLILVNNNNVASQFILAEGRIGEDTMQLPSRVQEVAFERSSSRAYFRTSRWVHRAVLSRSGLHWSDAVLAPPALSGASLVYGNGTDDPGEARRLFLPVAGNDFVEFVELGFKNAASTGLFGSRQELLDEWGRRFIGDHHEGF